MGSQAAPYTRVCSECPAPLPARKDAKTCSPSCRAKRSRRLRRNTKNATAAQTYDEHQRQVADVVNREAPDIAHEIAREELRPIVREAMTEEVLGSIDKLIGLTPSAVAALEQDIQSSDDTIRQRAYTLLFKYTVGHPAMVQPDTPEANQGITVNFALPRPDSPGGETQEDGTPIVEAGEYRLCNMCQTEKPVEQFVANSDRCEDCHEEMRSQVKELLGDGVGAD